MQSKLCHHLQVLRYTLVGIVNLLVVLYAMECRAFEPLFQIDIGTPPAPSYLQSLIEPCTHSLSGNTADGYQQGFKQQFPHQIKVIGGKGIEEVPVPICKPCANAHNSHIKRKDNNKQSSRQPLLLGHPPGLYQAPALFQFRPCQFSVCTHRLSEATPCAQCKITWVAKEISITANA